MPRAASFAAIILAAGESSRMGRDKALLPWPPAPGAAAASKDTFLSSAIKSLTLSADFVLVVAGENQPTLAPVVYGNAAFLALIRIPARASSVPCRSACGRCSIVVAIPHSSLWWTGRRQAPRPFRRCGTRFWLLRGESGPWFRKFKES